MTEPQVRPAPKPAVAMVSPGLVRPAEQLHHWIRFDALALPLESRNALGQAVGAGK